MKKANHLFKFIFQKELHGEIPIPGAVYEGGITITADAPLEYIPVFARDNFDLI